MLENFLIENIGLVLATMIVGVLLLEALRRKGLFEIRNEIERVESRLNATNKSLQAIISHYVILEREIRSCIKFHEDLNQTSVTEKQAKNTNDNSAKKQAKKTTH